MIEELEAPNQEAPPPAPSSAGVRRAILARPGMLRATIEEVLPDRPFSIQWWDGVRTPSTNGGGPLVSVRSPRALGHALRAPGQLGIGRAYVSGEIAVSDLDEAIRVLRSWQPPPLDGAARRRLLLAAVKAHGVGLLPSPPAIELKPQGERHSPDRDARAVRHHYDVSNEFFSLFLDRSMTYSCAIFSRGATTLEEAQEAKLELVCQKLGLREGEHVLDVGCGWGSLAIHAASRHGVFVKAVTLSEPQAELAREHVEAAGLSDRIDIQVMDWRELSAGSFDAIASIGMVEHVGSRQIDAYGSRLATLLAPGGRLLNHGIARLRHGDPEAGPFSERYVFPDAAPLHLSRIQAALERAGLETDTVEAFREDYATTLGHWIERLDANAAAAERLAGPERMRVWRLYLRAAREGFRIGFTGIYQVLAHRPR
ncbi:MAG TPA: cyclopropane-fatty-acyl-phospholipid synthase family protein [Solirubrobacteraceae bacterium]|nr:cyclopropane-fatty-acyl-phospholipid synthase family protein [Solirubrobacteraceae bacterium]